MQEFYSSMWFQTWATILQEFSTSTLSIIVFTLIVPTIIWMCIVVYRWRHTMSPLKDIFKDSLPTAFIAASVTLGVWFVIIWIFGVMTIYNNHQNLVSQISVLKKQAQQANQQTAIKETTQTTNNLTGVLQLETFHVFGHSLDSSSNTQRLGFDTNYEQKGERPIDDVFTYEIMKILPSNADVQFLNSSRLEAKKRDNSTKTKGLTLGVGQRLPYKRIELSFSREQIPDIENDKLRFYFYFYGSWKDSQSRRGSFEKCLSMTAPGLGLNLEKGYGEVDGGPGGRGNVYRCKERRQ